MRILIKRTHCRAGLGIITTSVHTSLREACPRRRLTFVWISGRGKGPLGLFYDIHSQFAFHLLFLELVHGRDHGLGYVLVDMLGGLVPIQKRVLAALENNISAIYSFQPTKSLYSSHSITKCSSQRPFFSAVAVVVAAFIGAQAESHTVTFDNRRGHGTVSII